jgi:hypothetical protein
MFGSNFGSVFEGQAMKPFFEMGRRIQLASYFTTRSCSLPCARCPWMGH